MDAPPVKLADLLRHPDDLDKLPALKLEFTRKKNVIDSQLRGSLRDQLETIQTGMNGLTDGQKTVQAIKEEMTKIDRLCSESQIMIKDFNNINLVSQAHRNFQAVEAMRKNLEMFNERLNVVENMLQEDHQDPETMPNLLAVHYELTQLRNIRDDAIEQIQRADDPGLQSTLEDYFSRLDDAIDMFDEHIGMVSVSLINLLIEDNNSLVVRLALIVEAEEKSDQRVEALQEALKDHKEMATRFQSITDGAKTVRGYKGKFIQAIKISCQDQFDEIREDFLGDPEGLPKLMKWYFNDLNAVKQGMVSLMPKKWRILQTYGNIYHELMHDFLVGVIDDPEASSANTLAIINWPEQYYKKMKKLGFAETDLKPHVIDNREQELVRGFRDLIIKFLDEWIDRIFAQETKDFANRNTEGSNLDIDAAGNSNRADVAEGVIDAMFIRLRGRQQSFQKMLEEESLKYEQGKVPELEGLTPLQDWLVATANDQIACIDDQEEDGRFAYLTSFKQKFEPIVTPQYMERADAEIELLRDGYVDFSTWCITKFVALVMAVDFKDALPVFFTPGWYTSATMKQIVNTFEDYLADYKPVLHFSLFDIFTEVFAEELLVRYLTSVRNKGAKFRRTDPFQDKIFNDISTAFEFFGSLANPDVGSSVKQTWRVLELFTDLIMADKEAIADVFERFKTAYWDLQLSWVEAVLRSRDDFERSMLNSVKARAAQMDVVRGRNL
ncbi:exocyst complex component Sec6 [Apiospora phragmitis]|uniref:Exocyst complex component Sec6 n=1 Tax=Apiospora phragmitis TaxID=2905665 RepID=A0ABR1WU71_9PEZI